MLYIFFLIIILLGVLSYYLVCKKAARLLEDYEANDTHWLWKLSIPNIVIKLGRMKDEDFVKPNDRIKYKQYYYYLKYSSFVYLSVFLILLIGALFF